MATAQQAAVFGGLMTAVEVRQPQKSLFSLTVHRWALVALLLCYLLQLHSPLRLSPDARAILNLTSELTDGRPYLQSGKRPLYPIGMPVTYSLMERAGIADSAAFGALNIVCICVAAYSTWVISIALGLRKLAPVVMLTGFSSWVLIKHAVIPLTDIPYFMTSLVCVALLERYSATPGGRKISTLLLAVISLAASMLTRRIGVALVPALIYSAWPSEMQRVSMRALFAANKAALIGLTLFLLAILIAASFVLRKALYLPDFSIGSPVQFVRQQFFYRFTDFGELLLNVPASQLPGLHRAVEAAGLVLTILILVGLWRTRKNLHPTHIYLLAYIAIMTIWPYVDARFWLPVVPLIAITVIQATDPLNHPRIKLVLGIYLAAYALAAFLAIAYSTRITFSGSRFPSLYASGIYRREYEDAWTGDAGGVNGDDAANTTYLIHRYGMVGAPKL